MSLQVADSPRVNVVGRGGSNLPLPSSFTEGGTLRVNASTARLSDITLIEQYTDHFFYQVNPELQGRKLTSTDREYIREWENLRAVIVPMIRPSQEVCPLEKYDVGWDFDLDGMPNSYSSVFDYLADIIFYNRYPQLIGKKLSPGTSEAKEWSVIRERLFVSTCGI